MRKAALLVAALLAGSSATLLPGCAETPAEDQAHLDRDPTEPAGIDFSTLKPGTQAYVEDVLDTGAGSLPAQFRSPVSRLETRKRIALLVFEKEMSTEVPIAVLRSTVAKGLDLDTIVAKLSVADETLERLALRLSTTKAALRSDFATARDDEKTTTLEKLFKLQYPPALPIATIEELATKDVPFTKVMRVLRLSEETVTLIASLEGHPKARGSMTREEDWAALPTAKRVELQTKLFKHENLIPAYEDPAADGRRTARLAALLDADQSRPGFWSNVGDFALASIVNIVSDYVFFNALRWNPEEHNGEPVSMAYRVYQVSLQAYTSLWLTANHGTGTGAAFWWNQWNATNDFGYYAIGTIIDKLGIKPEGWDGANWTEAVFNDRNPPTWFNWTLWALTHPGKPTTGTNIANGSLQSIQITAALLQPSLNIPWKNSTCASFWCKVSRFLSKLVPKAVF